MSAQKWVMSEGGPLIAVERELQASWGGICRLTVPAPGAANDYDRPPEKLDFIQTIELQHGRALIFGEGPVDTTFWQKSDVQIFIVRTIYCDADFDVDEVMHGIDENIFENPAEQIAFSFLSGNLSIFDSSEDGSLSDIDSIEAKISSGTYQIDTILHEPDEAVCLILHRLTKISDGQCYEPQSK